MDNTAYGCTGGRNGSCTNDARMYFQNKLGIGCTTEWLVNNYRWKKIGDGINGNDAFDGPRWDYFDWYEAGCIASMGFYVPNKVR